MRRLRFGIGTALAVIGALLFVQPATAQTVVMCAGFPATIVGTEGDDVLFGTDGNDVISGLDGRDIIFGFGGRDILCGDGGRDRLDGGRQSDLLLGGENGDLLKGGTGADFLFGEQGNDRLIGGNGDDELDGGRGRLDRQSGRGGFDSCFDAQLTTLRDNTCEVVLSELLDFNAEPTFGSVELDPGFTPDPFSGPVTSGGTIDVRYLGETCFGYAAGPPDVTLFYGDGGDYLRFFFEPDTEGDTGLVIANPDGLFWCNDDFDGLNPDIEFFDPLPGVYDIWVTSIIHDELVDGTLSITEFAP